MIHATANPNPSSFGGGVLSLSLSPNVFLCVSVEEIGRILI